MLSYQVVVVLNLQLNHSNKEIAGFSYSQNSGTNHVRDIIICYLQVCLNVDKDISSSPIDRK